MRDRLGAIGMFVALLVSVSLVSAALFCAFPWAVTAGAGSSSPDSIDVRKQVDEGNATFVKAWQTGDAALFASCFAEDGATLHPGGHQVLGKEEILNHMTNVFSKVRMTEGTITTVDLFVLGDIAYETGKWKFAIGAVGQAAEPDSGYYVEVWKRVGKGQWKMWRDIGVPGN